MFRDRKHDDIITRLVNLEETVIKLTAAVNALNPSSSTIEIAKPDDKPQRAEHLPMCANDFRLMQKYIDDSGFLGKVANNVKRQKWISPKQRAVLERGPRYTGFSSQGDDSGDWDMEDDMEQADFWGIDPWGIDPWGDND